MGLNGLYLGVGTGDIPSVGWDINCRLAQGLSVSLGQKGILANTGGTP